MPENETELTREELESLEGEPLPDREVMSLQYRKLSREELDELAGEELPERAAMSLINANVAAPAVALNVLSDNSAAIANAQQTADID